MGGMTRLLLLLWAGVTVSTAVDLYTRILGGRPCYRPYHVKIVHGNGGLLCGGSLISDTWILTAAHCWELDMFAVIPGQAQLMRIVAPPEMFSNNSMVHDIMLLQLPQPVQAAATVRLPDCQRRLQLGDSVQIAGFAATITRLNNRRQNFEVPLLQCADIPYMPCVITANLLQYRPQARSEHLICGQTHHADVSFGDSGGGVVWNDTIHGVISATRNAMFAFAAPAVFMDVCGYINWIRNVTGI